MYWLPQPILRRSFIIPPPQREGCGERQKRWRNQSCQKSRNKVILWQSGFLWQIVDRRPVHEQEESIEIPNGGIFIDAIQVSSLLSPLMKCIYSFPGPFFEFIQVAKGDRISRASLRACRLYAILLPVIAQGALSSQASVLISTYHAKWA